MTAIDFDTDVRDIERVKLALRQLKAKLNFLIGEIEAADALYQLLSQKNAASGYAGLNSVSRTTKGVDATDDLIVDSSGKGLVLKDTAGTPHYWRVQVTTLGLLTITDLGTTKP